MCAGCGMYLLVIDWDLGPCRAGVGRGSAPAAVIGCCASHNGVCNVGACVQGDYACMQ